MEVTKVRVRSFKSIDDSGACGSTTRASPLVGKNKSGKTVFLQALYRLNPLSNGHPQAFPGRARRGRLRRRLSSLPTCIELAPSLGNAASLAARAIPSWSSAWHGSRLKVAG